MNSERPTEQAKSKADSLLAEADRIIKVLESLGYEYKEMIILDLRKSILNAINAILENLMAKVREQRGHIDDFLDLDKQAIFIVGIVNEQTYPAIQLIAVALVDNPESLPESTERRRLMRLDNFLKAMDRLREQLMSGKYDTKLTEDPFRLIFQGMAL